MSKLYIENDMTLENFWRSIFLFGKNTASYKFALAKSLLEIDTTKNFISLEELALPYSKNISLHLEKGERQITRKTQVNFLESCKKFNEGQIDQSKLIEETLKTAFDNVIPRFHTIFGLPIYKITN